VLCAVASGGPASATPGAHNHAGPARVGEIRRMWMSIGDRRFVVDLADTAAARAFAARLPVTLHMAELNGNEKHADLRDALPADARRPGTIHNGDVMLYGTRTVVVFYKSFRSGYAYTRLGRVAEPADLPAVLGRQDATIIFTSDTDR
jgi:hypothetical protein